MAYDNDDRNNLESQEHENGSVANDNGAGQLAPSETAALDQIEAGLNDRDTSKSFSNLVGDMMQDEGVQDSGFYTGSRGKGSGKLLRSRLGTRLGGFMSNRRVITTLGAGIVVTIVGSISLFGFLNVFKLDHLLSNIDAKTFARFNAAAEGRSDRWVQAYLTLRLMEIDGEFGDQNNLFFKAKPDHPIRDFYKNMRTSRFEKDLFEKQNIQFVSIAQKDPVNGGIKFRTGFISIKDTPLDFDANARYSESFIKDVIDGKLDAINKLGADLDGVIETKIFKNNKEARRAIKTAVNDNTSFLTAYRRRHIRKDLQRRIGVTEWKVFERKRDDDREKKSEIQKKLLQKLIPADTRSGKFMLCLFGAGDCPRNTDHNNSDTHATKGFAGTPTDSEGERKTLTENTDGSVTAVDGGNGSAATSEVGSNSNTGDIVDAAVKDVERELSNATADESSRLYRAKLLRLITARLNAVTGALSIVNTMDMLSRVDSNIRDGKLSALATIAKGTQAAAAYTTYAIMRDQAKSGELVSDEYGEVMKGLNGAENSEAYSFFFNNNTLNTVAAASSKEAYCAAGYTHQPGDYVWNCDSYKIGGSTNGTKIEDAYRGSIGKILSPTMDSYRAVRDTPGIKQAFDFTAWAGDQLSSVISSITDPIISALGLEDDIQKVLAWFTEQLMSFIGAGPILTGIGDPPGLTLNQIAQGSAYVAENTMRSSGAASTTLASKEYADKLLAQYNEDRLQGMSLSEKYLSFANPDSFASKVAFSAPSSLASFFSGAIRGFGSIISPAAFAQQAQSPAEFAGIETYDFSPQCIENEPLTVLPQDLTNADDLGLIPRNEITLELLENYDSFWSRIYSGINEDNEAIARQVYNCATFDMRIRGSIGYKYGYTDDGGLDDSSAASAGAPSTTFGVAGQDVPAQDTSNIACPSSPNITEAGVQDGYKSGVLYRINTCRVHGVVVNAIIAKQYDEMFTAMKAAGFDIKGSGGFRTMEGQRRLYADAGSNTAAKPGYSNHQFGTAVDIVCSGGGKAYDSAIGRGREEFARILQEYPCLKWVNDNSSKYGVLLQCNGVGANGGEIRAKSGGCEAWHLSPTGG